MKTYQITLDEAQAMRMGSASLMGMLCAALPGDTVELIIPQTSTDWRRENGGPDQWILNEYNLGCIIESVIWFGQNNIKVIVTWTTK